MLSTGTCQKIHNEQVQMYTQFLGTTRRSLTAFGGPGYPQFRANRAPFLRFAPEQPLRAAATIPGAFRTESKKNRPI